MPRQRAQPFTPLELDIMKVLWDSEAATVQEVQQRLVPSRELAYNTVQTMLNVLHRKGKVSRQLDGRAFRYRPVVSRPQTARAAVSDLVRRMFDGSAEELVLSLVDARQLTAEKLGELSRLLAANEADDER
jgi:predicted transcriptional regulator